MALIRTKRDADHVDLIAAESAERDGDTIVVTPADEPPRRRPPVWVFVTGGAVVALALIALGVAIASGDDDKPSDTVAASDVEETATTDAPRTTVAATQTVPDTAPTAPIVDESPDPTDAPVVPIAPPPTAPAAPTPAALSATVSPNAATVTAGTPVAVTLVVRNTGGTAGEYQYDTDGCEPALVPGDASCIQNVRQVRVEPTSESAIVITIDTTGATPGTYTVPVGDQSVVVTISA